MANKSKKSKAQPKSKVKAKAKSKAPIKAKSKVKAKSKPAIKAKAKTKAKAKATPKAKAKKVSAPKKPIQKSKAASKKTSVAKQVVAQKPVKITDYSKAITPLADRLVIRVVQAEKVTPGGIIIPDSVSTVAGHLEGEVLAVGHGSKNKKGLIKALDVQVGDFVLFSEYSGTKVEFHSEELQIIKESDVMGIVQK